MKYQVLKLLKSKGFVYGLTVRSRGVGGQVSARFTLFSWW